MQVSWSKSPASDYGHVDAYAVYNKKVTDVVFPSIPALTRYDILDSYTGIITDLDSTSAYDFIVYAFTADLVKSTPNCASCKSLIPASYVIVGGGYSGGTINLAQKNVRLISSEATSAMDMHASAGDITFFLPKTTITEELLEWPMWVIPAPAVQFMAEPSVIEEFTKWPKWIIPR